MARRLQGITGSPQQLVTTYTYLRGVDLTNNPINVALGRAYDAPNMIRDVPGKVRKRMGYKNINKFGGRINGIFDYYGTRLIHAGTKLYDITQKNKGEFIPTIVSTGLPDRLSNGYCLNHKLMILTGQTMYCYYVENGTAHFGTASSFAQPAEVSVGRPPHGGGDAYPFNLLSASFVDSFLSDGTSTVYQLSYYPIKNGSVTVEIQDNNGEWQDATSTINFVNYNAGAVRFSTAPSLPVVSGEDNVRITAELDDNSEEVAKINQCTFGILYGMNGNMDRLFVSGNPYHKNNDWFSAVNDPLYFGDINYGEIGQDDSAITGYSVVDSMLCAHKANDADGRNIFCRNGVIDTETEDLTPVEFPIVKTIQGTGAIAPHSFGYLHEPLYLTKDGIYATTPMEINGVWYAQKRSYFLDGKLLHESGLVNAKACVWKDFYLLAVGDTVYILDTLQRDESGVVRSSQYQYECYYFTNVPVRCWYVDDDELVFGAENGKLYRFYTDPRDNKSYNDAGTPIRARWDFAHIGNNIYLDKTSWWISLTVDTTPHSSISLFYKRAQDANWSDMFWTPMFRYFSYADIDYGNFFYGGGGESVVTLGHKLKIKRYDSCRLSLRNYHLNEGIYLYAITLEYEEGRNYHTMR